MSPFLTVLQWERGLRCSCSTPTDFKLTHTWSKNSFFLIYNLSPTMRLHLTHLTVHSLNNLIKDKITKPKITDQLTKANLVRPVLLFPRSASIPHCRVEQYRSYPLCSTGSTKALSAASTAHDPASAWGLGVGVPPPHSCGDAVLQDKQWSGWMHHLHAPLPRLLWLHLRQDWKSRSTGCGEWLQSALPYYT